MSIARLPTPRWIRDLSNMLAEYLFPTCTTGKHPQHGPLYANSARKPHCWHPECIAASRSETEVRSARRTDRRGKDEDRRPRVQRRGAPMNVSTRYRELGSVACRIHINQLFENDAFLIDEVPRMNVSRVQAEHWRPGMNDHDCREFAIGWNEYIGWKAA